MHLVLYGHLHHSLAGVVHRVFFLAIWSILSSDRHGLAHQRAQAALVLVLIVAKELLDSVHS